MAGVDTPSDTSSSPASGHRRWTAAAIALGALSAVTVPLAVWAFLAPDHLGVPYEGKLAWLGGIPVWGAVECARKARAARAALR
jgi:hypothetical protein